jgi:hypothetical protein
MDILQILMCLFLTGIAFWLFTVAYAHAGKFPSAPPVLSWCLQALCIVVLIIVVAGIWGLMGGFDLHRRVLGMAFYPMLG